MDYLRSPLLLPLPALHLSEVSPTWREASQDVRWPPGASVWWWDETLTPSLSCDTMQHSSKTGWKDVLGKQVKKSQRVRSQRALLAKECLITKQKKIWIWINQLVLENILKSQFLSIKYIHIFDLQWLTGLSFPKKKVLKTTQKIFLMCSNIWCSLQSSAEFFHLMKTYEIIILRTISLERCNFIMQWPLRCKLSSFTGWV